MNYYLNFNYPLNNSRFDTIMKGNYSKTVLNYSDGYDLYRIGYHVEYAERSIIKCPFCKAGYFISWYEDIREFDYYCRTCEADYQNIIKELI